MTSGRFRTPLVQHARGRARRLAVYLLGVAKLCQGDVEGGVRLTAAGHAAAQQARAESNWRMELSAGIAEGRLDEAKAALPPERFAALWAEGEAMTAEEAIACALKEPD